MTTTIISGDITTAITLTPASYADPVTNAGTISVAAGSYALGAATSWIIVNTGDIAAPTIGGDYGVSLGAGGTLANAAGATIGGGGGVVVQGGAGTIDNAGTIIGANGTAVALASGFANVVDIAPGAVFQGIVDGGNSIGSSIQSTLSLQYASAGGIGTLTNLGTDFVNFRQISVTGAWDFDASDSLAAGVTLTDSNSGSATIGGYGLLLGTNDAVTILPHAAVTRANTAVTRTGAIYAGSAAGNVVIDNYGLISNPANTTAAGVALFDGGTIINNYIHYGTNTATGTIVGHDVGIFATAGAGIVTTVINAGTVEGLQDTGVDLAGAGWVSNHAGGTITAPQNALAAQGGGRIYNSGLIIATGATNSQGIYLNGGGAITNTAGGTIAGYVGIVAGASGAMTVVDAGTIEGSSYAIQFQAGADNALVLDPGAYVHGVVEGGNTAGSGFTTSLTLAAGTVSGTLDTGITRLRNIYRIDVASGGAWVVKGSGASLASGATIDDQGALTLATSLAGSGDILIGANATLAVMPDAAPSATISGFAGHETIEVVGGLATGITLSGSQLTIAGTGVTLDIGTALPASDFGFVTSHGNTYITACFAAGTRIAGAAGPVAVEALAVGDRVRTASGRLAPVRWLGHRRTRLRHHPRPHEVMPVRVRAGAFGDNLPSRDLVLSPDHAVFVDGCLVPVRHLANGRSIVQEARDTVTYWHVELDRHDVLFAEDLPCESYLDTGNRAAFENAEGPTALHPEFGAEERARRVWRERGCAPILVDPADPALRAIHTRLLARLPLGGHFPAIAPAANMSA